MRKKHKVTAPTLLDLLAHSSSEIAKSAFRTGNASGFHGKNKNKQDRMRTRLEERNAQRGEHPEESGVAMSLLRFPRGVDFCAMVPA